MEALYEVVASISGALVFVGLVALAGAGLGILLRTIFPPREPRSGRHTHSGT